MAKQKPRIKASSTAKKEARTSRTAEVSAPTKRPGLHIEVTPVVKNASKDARSAASNIDFEILTSFGINSAYARCTDDETAIALASQLTAFAKAFPGAQVVEFKAYGQEVSIPLSYYLPSDFYEVLTDLADTDLASIPVEASTAEQLKAYVQAFTFDGIVRTQLEDAAETAQPETSDLRTVAVNAHKALVSATTLIVRAISEKPVHLVRITPAANTTNDFQFVIDGQEVKLKHRSQRALCVLALLQPTQPFTCKQFMDHYSKSSGEARKDFHNIMRALKKDLPQVDWKSGKNKRWVRGVRIDRTAPEAELLTFLKT